MRPLSPIPRRTGTLIHRALGVLAVLAAACGAGNPPGPAAAAPRAPHAASAPKPGGTTRAAPPVIGALTADRVKLAWEAAVGGFGKAVAIDGTLGRVAAASGSLVKLYELASGRPAGSLTTCPDVIRGGLGFASRSLVVVCESGIQRFDPVKLTRLSAPRANPSRITAASLSGHRLALGHHDGVVRIYALDGAPALEIAVPGPPIDVKSLALDPAGKRVAVAWVQGSIWWWELAKPDAPHPLVRHESEADSVAFSDDGALFAEEGEPLQTTVWSFAGATPAERTKLKNGEWVKRLLFTRDGKWLIRGGADGLELAELGGPRRVALDTTGQVEDAALDERGAALAAIDRRGRLTAWRVR
ncbi:MAG: hypothetical protein OZ921_02295 [Sorangiineae bacterium]|nr:hypothetical protein [Polyangiaceae bacterium]MEB2321315.1 hypothetical protein [Sorangiineae bacterium]